MFKKIIIAASWVLFLAVCISCKQEKKEKAVIKVKTESTIENKKSIDYTSYFDEAQKVL